MKLGKCPKCSSTVEVLDKPLFMLASQEKNGRHENIVHHDYSTEGVLFTAYVCSNCNYTELYQESAKRL